MGQTDGDIEREKALHEARIQQRYDQMRKENQEAEEARELLELRSLGIRTAMRKYKVGQDPVGKTPPQCALS